MQVARIAATIAVTASGNPWLAVAINAGFSAIDVADGTVNWKHAMVQTAVSTAAAYAGGFAGSLYTAGTTAASTASTLVTQSVNMLASGISYDEGAHFNWNEKRI